MSRERVSSWLNNLPGGFAVKYTHGWLDGEKKKKKERKNYV